jgi:TP901 family phage tail tape measure protein
MADIESNIKVNIDTSDALSQLKLLQQQISAFQQGMKNAGAQNAAAAQAMQQNLMASINATGKFTANIQTIKTSAESFTQALEKNKLSTGEYFRYAGGASKTFGKLFKSEFDTIQQVAVDRVKTIQTQYIKLGRDASGAMKAIAVRPLALDMDNLGTKTQIAAQKQQLFNQLMKQGSTQLLNFGKNTQWAGRQLMVGFTIPLTLMGQAAAQAYMKIEAASLKFRRVYGDMNTTTEEANKMVKSVQALANEFTKYGVAVADTMEMAASAAAMGKTGTDLMQQVAQASKLAVLGQVEQQQALETTISLTNAFGVSTEELAKSVDFLNAVENQTVVSIEDLTIAIPKAAPVVKQLGGDVDDLTFFLTAMKEGGINASEGANALKSGLASLINPTKKASDFLAGFGVNVKQIVEGNQGDIKGVVVDFAKALDTLDPLNRARAIEQMFGKFQFSRLSTLFKNVIDEGSQAATVAGLSKQTAEELAVLSEREMTKISDSPMFKFQKSIESMQAKLAPVGEAFLKAVTPIIEFVTKILDGFNNLSEGTKSFVSILVLAIAGIGPILLMTFGLIANGVANIMKLFTNMKAFINKTTRPSDILGEQTSYMNSEQLKSAAIAASLDQSHSKLRQTFTSEAAAVQKLTDAYRNAVQAQQAYSGVPGVQVGNPNATPRKYANGVSMVPGPAGAGDIVPALLSPGEAVIPARSAKKYAPVIRGMIAGNLPGFEEGTAGVGMRQSLIGPLDQKQTEGIARTGKTLKEISDEVVAGPYGQVPVTNYGTQVSPSPGHSFPAFGVAGVYEKPDGSKVFVKPQIDLVSAMAEIRGTTIARDAHGLVAPEQSLRVMMDPTDPENKRKFLVLESALDERIANIPTSFTKEEYFKQLVASLLRGDKDLGVGNLGGNILADVGPAGVFQRASGKRQLGSKINSMEEQAIINLLGVKGGAKRFFAEATADIAKSMTPAEYDAAIRAEIQAVAPKLQATIAGFGNLSPEEKQAYLTMQQRLQEGLGVNWSQYQAMAAGVKPRKMSDGGFIDVENSQSFAQSLMSMSSDQIKAQLRVQDTHLVEAIDLAENPEVIDQIREVLPDVTAEELRGFEPVSNLTAQMPGNMNQLMKGSGYPPKIFASIWNGFRGKLSKSAEIAGVKMDSAQVIEDKLGTEIENHTKNVNDPEIGEIVQRVIGNSADIDEQKIYSLALRVSELRSKPKQLQQSDNETIHSIVLRMLQDGTARFNDNGTSIVRTIGRGNVTRFATWEYGSDKSAIGSGDANATIEEIEIRRRAQDLAYGPNGWATRGNFDADMPEANRKLVKPADWEQVVGKDTDWQKMGKEQKKAHLEKIKTYLSRIPGTDPKTLTLRKQDYSKGFGDNKSANKFEWVYTASGLKSGIKWNPSTNSMQLAYNEMVKHKIIPPAGQEFFKKIAMGEEPVKMAEGGVIPGGPGTTGKPKASVFDIDDTLLDLSSFMPAHKERNAKLPKEQRLNWWEEVAKDPKGIPAAIQRLKDAQLRGNKILLMTARPQSYDAVTMDTLQKLGIDMNGVKLISRNMQDRRKPEQMKYDKTSKYRQWYDIEEFYDDMPKTRGALGLMGINAIDPLKLAMGSAKIPGYANGVFSVPGPKGAGDVVPAMLSPGEAVIPAKQAAKHRPMIQQMIAGNLPGYAMGGIIPGYQYGIDSVPTGVPLKVIIVGDETKRIVSPENQEIKEITEGNTEEQKKATEETKKTRKSLGEYTKSLFTRTQATGQVQMGLYGVTSGLGIASTMGGGIGQAAQAAMVPLGAAATAMSLIPGKAGLIVAAFTAIGSTIFMVNEHLNKLRNEALDLGTAMGASGKSINKFAEFAKTVTGTQAMDKRRETSAGQFFNVVQGKTTFGESYMKSEAGKELVKSVGSAIKGGGLDQAKSLIVTQLSTAIASGALSPAQARSIASNLGAQLGDMSFGIEVSGRITDLVGPKGEDLKKEPLEIRMRLVADAVDQFKKQAEISNQGVGKAASNVAGATGVSAIGGIGSGVIAGVAGAAVAKGMVAAVAAGATQSAAGAMAGTILGAQAFGPVVGAIAAIGILTKAAIDAQGEIVKNAGYLQASLGSALSVQQQMVDSLTIDYEKRIAAATAAGDTAEATRLQNQFLTDQAELLQFNKEQTQEMYNILTNQGTGIGFAFNAQIANLDVAREGLKKAFEGTGQEVQAKLAQEQIDAMAGTNAQKTMLMSAVAQKQIGLNQIGVAQSAFGADQAGADTLQALMENSPTELNRTLGLAGSMGAVEQKKFLVDMSLKDPIDAKIMNDAVELAQKTTGVFFGQKKTAEAIMRFAVENPEKMVEFQENIAELKGVDAKTFSITVAQKILGPDLAKYLGEKNVGAYFGKYNKQNKIVFLSEFQQVMTMLAEGDEDMLASWRLWQKETGRKGTMADYAAYQADRTVTSQGNDNALLPGEGGNTAPASGPQASILDQFVVMARETSNFQQKLTTGWTASYAALKNYTTNSINLLAGWAVRLKQQGVSANMIDVFMGATEEEQDRILDKRTGKLKAGALELLNKLQTIQDQKEFGLSYVLANAAERMTKDNALYQAGLDVISNKEKKINDKYDKRIKALDDIGKIQEKNNQRQQDTLTLADALSKGDIAAAARAALTAKQNSQKLALEDAKESTELARKQELEAVTTIILGQTVTRDELEARIAVNSGKIAEHKRIEMNRQITIGKNAVIAADASARLLASGKLIAKLPGANTPAGTGTETGTTKKPTTAKPTTVKPTTPAPTIKPGSRGNPLGGGGDVTGMSVPELTHKFKTMDWVQLPKGLYVQGLVAEGTTIEITTSGEPNAKNIKTKGNLVQLSRDFGGNLPGIERFARGGMVYASRGLEVESSKYALGTDTIPAMLTAGEFVMKKSAVDRIGAETLTRMNDGTSSNESVYNYNITVNANSSDTSDIADAVLRQIKRVDSQRIRSSAI